MFQYPRLFECRCIQTYSPDKIGVAVGNDPVTQSCAAVERAGGGDEHPQPARFELAYTFGDEIVVNVELGRQVFVERVVYFDRPERHVRNDQVVPIIGDALLFETLNPYGCIRIECPAGCVREISSISTPARLDFALNAAGISPKKCPIPADGSSTEPPANPSRSIMSQTDETISGGV